MPMNRTPSSRPYLIGCSLPSDDAEAQAVLAALYGRGSIDHIQIQIIPETKGTFQKRLDLFAQAGIPTVIHAPHHGHGVNPCAPTAYDDRPPAVIRSHIEDAMAQTLEAADYLGAETIVMHAGRYEEGGRTAAETCFAEFLDRHFDPRMALENLPSVYAGYPLLGNTADDLAGLAGGKIRRFCLDFGHLYCTANDRGLSFRQELDRFARLDVVHHHLANNRRGSITDEHLELDHPEGGLDLDVVFSWIREHRSVATTLELKRETADVYVRQLQVFDRLYRHQSVPG
jgi:sugar phosphate isomerase/epimerase